MRGLLIYNRSGAERNGWFIDRLTECAKARGCELELMITNGDFDKRLCTHFDFAIVRTIDPRINQELEELGIPVFNNSKTSRVANDKWQTCLMAVREGIDVMDTVPLDPDEDVELLPYPIVIKSVDGHGGSEVFLANNAVECKQALSKLANTRAIAQRLCDDPGVDMRVYVMGDEIIAATKRTSKVDFRSNFSLGGDALLDTPTEDMLKTINKLRGALNFDFVGVDFIRHNGKWVLNEIEDAVGTRMLYSLTDIDAADKYIDYILKSNKIKINL